MHPLPCRLDLSRANAAYRAAFYTGLWLNAGLVSVLQRGSPRERRLRRLAYPRWSDAIIEDTERVLLGLVHAARAANPGSVDVHTNAEVGSFRDDDTEPLRVEIAGLGEVESRCLIDCTGATHRDEPAVLSMNLVVEGLPWQDGGEALALRHPDENRNVFVVPWRGCCIVGTHDRAFLDDPSKPLRLRAEWTDDLLRWLAPVHPELAKLERSRVRIVHAGLLPEEPGRPGEPAHRPRILERGRQLRVQGVKWTTALGVAERAIEKVARMLTGDAGALPPPQPLEHAEVLRASFLARDSALRETLCPGSSLRRGDVLFAVEHEWALGLGDVLLRRCGAASAGHPGRKVVAATAALLQRALDWSDREIREQLESFDADPRFAGNVPA